MKSLKKTLKLFTSRLFIFSFLILIQIGLLLFPVIFLSNSSGYFYIGFTIISVIISVFIANRNINPMFKLAWIIPTLVFPFLGGMLYLIFGRGSLSQKARRKMRHMRDVEQGALTDYPDAITALARENASAAKQARYIANTSQSPVFINSQTEYLTPGECFYERLMDKLQTAEHFIFLEYFILREGQMLDSVLEILAEKVKRGVEVRFLYDDLGSINTLDQSYPAKIRAMGIRLVAFNPYKPSPDVFLNYRDHRKICVIDGVCAFTGGVNLADEYINRDIRFGHWKDSSMMICGDAVAKFTMMFLSLWHFQTGEHPDYAKYLRYQPVESDGYVQPFNDEPLDEHRISEMAYINVINHAIKNVYITTPYLILDNEMLTALSLAAQSGVDVRIVTPHIPDKKLVFMITRANYEPLIEAGVKIYEYTPGFMHAKSIVVDDQYAIVGTTNFDYRSFYLHFENGVWMYKTKCVEQVREDFMKVLPLTQPVTLEMCRDDSRVRQLVRGLVKIFSPMM